MDRILDDMELEARLIKLHALSESQDQTVGAYFQRRGEAGELSWEGLDAQSQRFMADKLAALQPAKAGFCYLTCRALRARKVVEVGTTHGVSTMYLAAAVRDNGGGVVIGTEHEPDKCIAARANFEAAGLSKFVELREGDLRKTLKTLEGPIDFVLIDIWVEMARPAIELIAPHLRTGAVICADNTSGASKAYAAYFAFINDRANGFRTMTLPFDGGFELTVKVG